MMNAADTEEIENILTHLKNITNLIAESEGSLLESSLEASGDGLELRGNTAGLLHLACRILDLCTKDYEGAHLHLDEHSDLPEGSTPIIIFRE